MTEQRKSRPSPYRGKLNPESASIGISTAKSNAKRLLNEAQALMKQERYPSACAFACLAVEEASKPSIIRKLLLASSPEEVRRGWQLFASHHDKAAPWVVPHIISSMPETYEQFVEVFMRQRDLVLLNSLKQLSIYCGCYGNCHWSAPTEVITEKQAEIVICSARILTLSGQVSPLDSKDSLNLWQEHMNGCFSIGYVTANNKIVEFFKKAAEAGILSSGEIPKEVAFDFMSTALVLSDGEAKEQMHIFDINRAEENA